MQTHHTLHIGDARNMGVIADESVQLVATSPPYPMIEMWDECFSQLDPGVGASLAARAAPVAFQQMHAQLDIVWRECTRVLSPGGFLCVNIGDATRSIGDEFALYPNHARVVVAAQALGLTVLPDILWRKPTNAPNKFMGSGMLPAGAYVTYEHEYILIFRKGGKRRFSADVERGRRLRSAFFWEERNLWFSDLWSGIVGSGQGADAISRKRSAAFPFEIPYRLINMYSLQGDTVLDPFSGTGTTRLAAVASARNSIGFELDSSVDSAGLAPSDASGPRLAAHLSFVEGRKLRHHNTPHDFPVVTSQETELALPETLDVAQIAPFAWRATHGVKQCLPPTFRDRPQ